MSKTFDLSLALCVSPTNDILLVVDVRDISRHSQCDPSSTLIKMRRQRACFSSTAQSVQCCSRSAEASQAFSLWGDGTSSSLMSLKAVGERRRASERASGESEGGNITSEDCPQLPNEVGLRKTLYLNDKRFFFPPPSPKEKCGRQSVSWMFQRVTKLLSRPLYVLFSFGWRTKKTLFLWFQCSVTFVFFIWHQRIGNEPLVADGSRGSWIV